jgi:hypothetical protein
VQASSIMRVSANTAVEKHGFLAKAHLLSELRGIVKVMESICL